MPRQESFCRETPTRRVVPRRLHFYRVPVKCPTEEEGAEAFTSEAVAG
jgi:hypothetical protein